MKDSQKNPRVALHLTAAVVPQQPLEINEKVPSETKARYIASGEMTKQERRSASIGLHDVDMKEPITSSSSLRFKVTRGTKKSEILRGANSRKVDFVERRMLKQTEGEYVEGRNLTFVIHEPLG